MLNTLATTIWKVITWEWNMVQLPLNTKFWIFKIIRVQILLTKNNLFCYGFMSMWLCALNFFPLNYILWLDEDGIGVKICCRYFGIVVVMLLANSFVRMFDTITRMLFDTIAITYFFQVTKNKSKDDLKKLPYNAELEFRFAKLYKHTNINDMWKNVSKGKENQYT